MFAVMAPIETAANSVAPKWPTLKTDTVDKEFCNRKVATNGIDDLTKDFNSKLAVVDAIFLLTMALSKASLISSSLLPLSSRTLI